MLDKMFKLSPHTAVLLPPTGEEVEVTPEQQEKYNRRAQRQDHCGGTWMRHFNPETGRIVAKPYICNLWRDMYCMSCFERRRSYLRGRMHKAALDARKDDCRQIKAILVSKYEASKLVRNLDKAEYLRLPTEDGDWLFVDSDNFDGASVTYDEISHMNWDQLTMTPGNRKISGSLGKQEPEDSLEDSFNIIVKSFVVDSSTSLEQEEAALKIAVEETKDLPCETQEDVQRAVDKRTTAYIKALIAEGGNVLPGAERYLRVTCRISRISWKGYTGNLPQNFRQPWYALG